MTGPASKVSADLGDTVRATLRQPSAKLKGAPTPAEYDQVVREAAATLDEVSARVVPKERRTSLSFRARVLADLLLGIATEYEEAYHAGPVNGVTVGIEIAQKEDGAVYEGQLDAVVKLCLWLSTRLAIQRQIPGPYTQGIVTPRCAAGGRDVVGFYGHRNVTPSRGFGDPGDAVFEALEGAGFERTNFSRGQDLDRWKARQAALGMAEAEQDGIPGPKTCAAIATWQEANGFKMTGVLTAEEREMLDRGAGEE